MHCAGRRRQVDRRRCVLAALCRAAGVEAIKRAVAAAQPPEAVRVQRGDVQIALDARRRRGVGGRQTSVVRDTLTLDRGGP